LLFGRTERKDWLLGHPFLKSVYSIYDLANRRIGLVPVNSQVNSSQTQVSYSGDI
jgi:hypothetical protein